MSPGRGATAMATSSEIASGREPYFDLPSWQKRGIGATWEDVERVGTDPRTGAEVKSTRRRISLQWELPMKTDYDAFIRNIVETQ